MSGKYVYDVESRWGLRGLRYDTLVIDEILDLDEKFTTLRAALETPGDAQQSYKLRDLPQLHPHRNDWYAPMETLMSTPHVPSTDATVFHGPGACCGATAQSGKSVSTVTLKAFDLDEEFGAADDHNIFAGGNGFDQDISYVLTYQALQRLNKVIESLRRAVTGQITREFNITEDRNETKIKLILDGGEDLEDVLEREKLELNIWASDDETRVVLNLTDVLPEQERLKRGVSLWFEASGQDIDDSVAHLLMGLTAVPSFPNHLKARRVER